MDSCHWNEFNTTGTPWPWVESLSKIVAAANPPLLNGSTLYITTDYGGSHSKSKYLTISILVVDMDHSREWEYKRRVIRKEFLNDGRRMSFKNLNDALRRRALIPFLRAADSINGLCIALAIQKSISSLVLDKQLFDRLKAKAVLQGKWRSDTFETMARIAHFVSLLVAGLAKPNQNIYWISDEDGIFANAAFSSDVAWLMSVFTSYYVQHDLGELGIGTTKLDEGDRLEEDFASIPDIVAGALAELVTAIGNITSSPVEQLVYPLPNLSSKTRTICTWLNDDSQNLKRLMIVFDKVAKQQNRIWRLSLAPTHA